MKKAHYDICILGLGIVGDAIALLIQKLSLKTIIVAAPFGELPHHLITINLGSWKILTYLGITPFLKTATAVQKIHVSEYQRMGLLELEDQGKPLGFVCQRSEFIQALHQAISKRYHQDDLILDASYSVERYEEGWHIHTMAGQKRDFTASCLIIAEGRNSSTRNQLGIPLTYQAKKTWFISAKAQVIQSNSYQAYERLVTNGVLALVPHQPNLMHIAWLSNLPVPENKIQSLIYQYVRTPIIKAIDLIQHFPFQAFYSHYNDSRLILAGDTHYAISPFAAQGFNHHVQHAWLLYLVLQQALRADWSFETWISHYQHSIKKQQDFILSQKIYDLSTCPWLSLCRSMGLSWIHMSSTLKKKLLYRFLGLPVPHFHDY